MLPQDIASDIQIINKIDVIPTILDVVCRATGMGFAAVARVTDTHWVACAVLDHIHFGLKPGGELILETTICNEIRQSGEAVIIDHVNTDSLYCHHHTPAQYGFQSYISIPIINKDGSFFGTLCAIDPNPAKLNNPETIGMFRLFADLISQHLDTFQRLSQAEMNLLEEKKTAELRDQFIAILGHDLRNPLSAVQNVAQLMMRMSQEERMLRLAQILQDASFRMRGLIDNVLDFASGQLGGGIVLTRTMDEPLENLLLQVITELQLIWTERTIEAEFNISADVYCDGKRIAQLFSNLLGNALTYGDKNKPVTVRAASDDKTFSLSVTNKGGKIPDKIMKRLFAPFSRGEVQDNKQGLGLGLFIASEIARAHGGSLTAESIPDQTTFTLTIPIIQ